MCDLLRRLFAKLRASEYPEIKDREYFNADGKLYVDNYYTHMAYLYKDDSDFMALDYGMTGYRDEDPYISTLKNVMKTLKDTSSRDEEIARYKREYGLDRYKGGLSSFIVEDGIKRIGNDSFAYNLSLERIDLPDSLETIGKCAFHMCRALKEITIPENVRRIGEEAFDDQIRKIYVKCANPPEISVLGIDWRCEIYVPDTSYERYTKRWKRYGSQIKGIKF